MYGEDGLYGRTERTGGSGEGVNGGLSVRTTLDPKLQKIGRRVLIDGLVAFDRERGWRGPYNGKRIDIAGDWGVPLSEIEIPTDLAPWRLGVVLRGGARQGHRRPAPAARAGRQAGRRARGASTSPSRRSSGPRSPAQARPRP